MKINPYKLTITILTYPLYLASILLHLIAEILLIPAAYFYRLPEDPDISDMLQLVKRNQKEYPEPKINRKPKHDRSTVA